MDESEKLIFNNDLGSVTDKRVIIFNKSETKSFLINHILSVSLERKNNIFLAIVNFLVSIISFISLYVFRLAEWYILLILLIFGIVFLAICLAYYLGNYYLQISSGIEKIKPIKIEMSKTKEGKLLFNAIYSIILK